MIELSASNNSDFLKMPRRTLTGDAKWKDIEDLINRWAKRNPREAYELEQYIKQAQSELTDKRFGKSKAEALGRLGVAIPPGLMQYIQAFYPEFMDTKEEMHQFMNKFPKFKIPEQV